MTGSRRARSYDDLIRRHNPAMSLALSSPQTGRETDLSARNHTGTYHPAARLPSRSRLPNGDPVAVFDGATQYLEVPDANDLSVTSRRKLTIEAWIRPDTLQFPSQERAGYVPFLGKGGRGQHEYVARMYSKVGDHLLHELVLRAAELTAQVRARRERTRYRGRQRRRVRCILWAPGP